ncbi:MAG: hypothetical protein NC218_00450 [Acetobacter sp.]|nr:hypothetical protein [Acetobacter sp.]
MQDELSMELGAKLSQADVHLGKIISETVVKILIIAVIIFAGVRGHSVEAVRSIFGVCFFAVILLTMVGWALLPLVHFKDYIVFYEEGIEFCQKKWRFDELGEISFSEISSNVMLFTKIYMYTDVKTFDITYIKNGKKNFNRAYYKTI